jgi:hypothetical protein
MNNEKLEKQASSEIAQSRAKSEILFTRYTGLEIDPIAYDFDDSQREKIFAFTDWCMEAAERDTRERCAQLHNDELYEAYLLGCEDEGLPEPLTKGEFLASWEDTQEVK